MDNCLRPKENHRRISTSSEITREEKLENELVGKSTSYEITRKEKFVNELVAKAHSGFITTKSTRSYSSAPTAQKHLQIAIDCQQTHQPHTRIVHLAKLTCEEILDKVQYLPARMERVRHSMASQIVANCVSSVFHLSLWTVFCDADFRRWRTSAPYSCNES